MSNFFSLIHLGLSEMQSSAISPVPIIW